MSKITPTEFKNYTQKFLLLFKRVMETPRFKEDSEENKEKAKSFFAVLLSYIEQEVFLPLMEVACWSKKF